MALYNVYATFGGAGRRSRVYSFIAADDAEAEQFVVHRLHRQTRGAMVLLKESWTLLAQRGS